MAEYTILRGTTPVDLEILVNKYLEDGWKPLGGVSAVALADHRSMYSQAMTRE